jgi:hypothetical protein
MIELRWRKAEGLTHFHSAQVGMGPATVVEACGERNAVKNAGGGWVVLQYRVPAPEAPWLRDQMWSEWEDVPVATDS